MRAFHAATRSSRTQIVRLVMLIRSILAGPAFEYREYIDTVTGVKYGGGDNGNGNGFKADGIPPRGMAVLSKLVTGLICVVIHQVSASLVSTMCMFCLYTGAVLLQWQAVQTLAAFIVVAAHTSCLDYHVLWFDNDG
jgi:hypothetical protein